MLDVPGFDRDAAASDILQVTAVDTIATIGMVTINPDHIISSDPSGLFADLNDGETATDRCTYTATVGNGSFNTATVTPHPQRRQHSAPSQQSPDQFEQAA